MDKIVADVKYIEKGEYPLDVRVEVDAEKDEPVALTSKFTGKDASFAGLDGGKPVLKIETDGEVPEQLGTLEVIAVVGQEEIAGKAPVEIRFTDKLAKLFQKYLPFLIAGLVLLLLILWYALLRSFQDQQVRPFVEGQFLKTYALRDWGRGLKGRKAVGTPELKEAVAIKLAGLKGFSKPSCSAATARQGVQLMVNGVPPRDAKAPLRHADEVTVTADNEEWIYYYFERPPTDAELQAIIDASAEKDNLYLDDEG